MDTPLLATFGILAAALVNLNLLDVEPQATNDIENHCILLFFFFFSFPVK